MERSTARSSGSQWRPPGSRQAARALAAGGRPWWCRTAAGSPPSSRPSQSWPMASAGPALGISAGGGWVVAAAISAAGSAGTSIAVPAQPSASRSPARPKSSASRAVPAWRTHSASESSSAARRSPAAALAAAASCWVTSCAAPRSPAWPPRSSLSGASAISRQRGWPSASAIQTRWPRTAWRSANRFGPAPSSRLSARRPSRVATRWPSTVSGQRKVKRPALSVSNTRSAPSPARSCQRWRDSSSAPCSAADAAAAGGTVTDQSSGRSAVFIAAMEARDG